MHRWNEKKQKLVQYRKFFDKILASPVLTNNEMLKKLVESQLFLKMLYASPDDIFLLLLNTCFVLSEKTKNSG
ncbi:hypothetical protein Ahy_B01g055092 isoform C [Arachis hypogaea]|uniref:Uncharacterized protein n=1 Tax=Arachis hypogaea TaxID=3818 RepID=A0A445AV14_ARAHY|nr:hypothetical protein Ahy_B01g055092 isoform C [Arachis hypogaea]